METGATLKDYIESGQIELVYHFYKGGLCSLNEIDFTILQILADNLTVYWDWDDLPFMEYEAINLGGVYLYSSIQYLDEDKIPILNYEEDMYIIPNQFIDMDYFYLDFYASGSFSKNRSALISDELIGDKNSFALWLFSILNLEK